MTVWSESYPGLVMAACGVTEGAFEVHHQTGRMLRQGGEARLCFECGPGGGVYHPDMAGIRHSLRVDGLLSVTPAWPYLRAVAAEFDKHFNQFEVHQHHTFVDGRDGPNIQHSHTEGSVAHKHPETASAWFGHRGQGVGIKPTSQPHGPQLAYVELAEDEATFRVVVPYQYINLMAQGTSVRPGRPLTARERKAVTPPPEWSRVAFRQTMDVIVMAARYPEVYSVASGGGAIDMTAKRMQDDFRLTPIYEIPGWTPTPFTGLPA